MIIPNKLVEVFKNTAVDLKGVAKRVFMANVVNAYGRGAQTEAEKVLGWCRTTIRKGQCEVKSKINCIDNFCARGRKKAEEKNPKLLEHIRQVVDNEIQADPAMNSERVYIRMTANAVRKQLKKRFEYTDDELPARITVSRKLNQMGYFLKKVRKTIPKKRSLKQTKYSKI